VEFMNLKSMKLGHHAGPLYIKNDNETPKYFYD
jgi:hypothetical protein